MKTITAPAMNSEKAGEFAHKYLRLLKFGASSLVCAATDLAVFSLLSYNLFGRTSAGILAATALARCLSGTLNFTLNKNWCFTSRGNNLNQAVKYFILFSLQLLLSWSIVALLAQLPVNLTLLKMLADSGLFVLSYFIQRHFIFKGRPSTLSNLALLRRAAKKG